jgi:hypothetical protein
MKQIGFTFNKKEEEDYSKPLGNIEQKINYTELVAKKFSNNEIFVKPVFSIPFFTISKLSNWEEKKNNLLKILNEYQDKVLRRGNVLSSYNKENYSDSYQNFIEKITEIFNEELHLIYEVFGSEKYPDKKANILDAWFQEQKENMYHGPHIHGMNGLSVICFLEYDEKEHTSTQFISPYQDTLRGNFLNHSEKVTEGTMLIFPSNIMHYTEPNQSKKSRIIFSMNVELE